MSLSPESSASNESSTKNDRDRHELNKLQELPSRTTIARSRRKHPSQEPAGEHSRGRTQKQRSVSMLSGLQR